MVSMDGQVEVYLVLVVGEAVAVQWQPLEHFLIQNDENMDKDDDAGGGGDGVVDGVDVDHNG